MGKCLSKIDSNLIWQGKEGFGRKGAKDKCQFYIISRGSAYETQSHLLYGLDIGYFAKEKISELIKQYNDLIHDLNKIIKSISQP